MVRYKMLAKDMDAVPSQYRTWVVDDEPDFTGKYYTGLKSGNRPFENTKAYLLDDYSIANFNFPSISLPNYVNWSSTKQVLPDCIYDAQLVIIDGYNDGYYDGYAYILGGQLSNKIWQAQINNPTVWEDTGSLLPTALAGSQSAVIGDRIYLFGGESDTLLDVVYSASIFNPTEWIDHGSVLPAPLKKSQLAIINNNIYLFGGYSLNGASSAIFRASASDPLTWEDTGAMLPAPVHSSHLGIINDRVYLFGGKNSANENTTAILTASLSDPTNWAPLGNLPYATSNGQFFTIGNKGYLIAPGFSTPQFYRTKILSCDLTHPTQWINTQKSIPGSVSESQLAIIYDRVFLFGGNGMSVIFSSNSLLKYNMNDPTVISYGDVTRVQYPNTFNHLDLFKVLGFPNWKADYGV
jgi:N-acetylneuraminic acid mutarotase